MSKSPPSSPPKARSPQPSAPKPSQSTSSSLGSSARKSPSPPRPPSAGSFTTKASIQRSTVDINVMTSVGLGLQQNGAGAVLIPEGFVTTNNGFEVLGTNWDVYARESPAASIDFAEHERSNGTRILRSVMNVAAGTGLLHTRSSLTLPEPMLAANITGAGPTSSSVAVPAPAHAEPNDWYVGWRVEYSMDADELSALRTILASPSGDLQPPLPNGVDLKSIIKKLHAGATSVAGHADRLNAQTQQAYGQDIPRLRSQIVGLEQQQHETNIRYKSIMDAVNLQATAARDRLYEADRHRREDEVIRQQQERDLEQLRKEQTHLRTICKQIREVLICPICTEVALLPKVLGSCGHIACQNCLRHLDDVAFASLTSAVGGASARQHLLARRCPLCRVEIIGGGFPCLPLKETASILILNNLVEVSEQASVQKHLEFKAISYEKDSAEAKHIHALQLGCYAQSQLAQHSVSCVVATVTADQWTIGVYILFESAVSRVFFETFATTLQGKAGGVNVLVNAHQRMLAVQLLDKKKTKPKPNDQKSEGHLLIKVATDGRFAISNSSETSAPPPGGGTTISPGAGAGAAAASAGSNNSRTASSSGADDAKTAGMASVSAAGAGSSAAAGTGADGAAANYAIMSDSQPNPPAPTSAENVRPPRN